MKPERVGHVFLPMQQAKKGDDHVFDLEQRFDLEQQVPLYRSSDVTLGQEFDEDEEFK